VGGGGNFLEFHKWGGDFNVRKLLPTWPLIGLSSDVVVSFYLNVACDW